MMKYYAEEDPPTPHPRDVFHGNIQETCLIPDLNVELVDDDETEDRITKTINLAPILQGGGFDLARTSC